MFLCFVVMKCKKCCVGHQGMNLYSLWSKCNKCSCGCCGQSFIENCEGSGYLNDCGSAFVNKCMDVHSLDL